MKPEGLTIHLVYNYQQIAHAFIILFLAICCWLTATSNSFGQAIPVSNNYIYHQNFNTLTPAGEWTNGITLNGWYAASEGFGSYDNFKTSNGDDGEHGLYSFGTNNSDRALGSITQDASGNIMYGVLFSNNSGTPIRSVTVSLRAEQWRKVNTSKKGFQRVKVSYRVANVINTAPINLLSETYRDIPEAYMITLDTLKTTESMNGNAPGNFATLSVQIPVEFPSGSQFFLRFLDENTTGIDAALALDDLEVTFASSNVGQVTVNSDYSFASYLDQGVLTDIPGDDIPNLYTVPQQHEQLEWSAILTEFFSGIFSDQSAAYGYSNVAFINNGSGARYHILRKNNEGSRYWGTYASRILPTTPTLTLQAPHPIKDRETERQAASIFEITGAAALMIAGTDRCNSSLFSECDGQTDVCNPNEKYRRSDVAHDTETIFHVATVALGDARPEMTFVQLHGFAQGNDDPDFIVSAGLLNSMQKSGTDYPAIFREALKNSQLPAKGIKVPHLDNYSTLAARDNVQGRFLNRHPGGNFCESQVDPPSTTNRFLHIEQYKTVRIDPNYYHEMAMIINSMMTVATESAPAIAVADANTTYQQNFDNLPALDEYAYWANSIPLHGWHAARTQGGLFSNIQVGTGSAFEWGLYSYGELQSQDRALGSLNQDASGDIAYGVHFRNTSGNTIGSITLSYRAEQWRIATTEEPQRVELSYAVGQEIEPSPVWILNNDNFSPLQDGDLVTPHTGAQFSQAVNGNANGNNQSIQVTVPLVLHDGEDLFIRFRDENASSVDHSLGLDDFSITFVPQTTVKPSATSLSVNEDAGSADLVIDIENPSNLPTEFDLELIDGEPSAVAGFGSKHIIVPPHQTQWIETITISDDADPGPEKQLTFQINNVTGGTNAASIPPTLIDLTIVDNDNTTISFVSEHAFVEENAGTYAIELMIVPPTAVPASVDVVLYAMTGEPADLNNFEVVTVQFNEGSGGLATATITLSDDLHPEGDESFEFRLQNVQVPYGVVGSNNSFTLTIDRNDLPSIIINEILAWPSETPLMNRVDANGDGTFSEWQDEFIELVNGDTMAVDISQWKLGNDENSFTLPSSLILQPGEAVIVFGGYAGPVPDRINGTRVFFANAPGLQLPNSNGHLNLWNENHLLISSAQYGQSAIATSFSRVPDVVGAFSAHPEVDDKRISPGLRADGSVFLKQLGFVSTSGTISESAGSYDLHIRCLSPADQQSNTTFSVQLISGNPLDIGEFTVQNVSANSGVTDIIVTVPITNNNYVTGATNVTFEITNLNPGAYTQVYPSKTFTLTIEDDDNSAISFDADSDVFTESEGSYTLTINLSSPAINIQTSVDVVLTHGSSEDIGGFVSQHLVFSGTEHSKQITLNLTDDGVSEGDEKFSFSLQNAQQEGASVLIAPWATFELTILQNDLSVLIMNEIHGSPSAISPPGQGHGDANGDGIRTAVADEFIELVNTTELPLDISRWVVKTGPSQLIRHTFPVGTVIPAHGALVLFGGKTPTGRFGGSLVQVCNAMDVANLSAAVTPTNGLIANGGTLITIQDLNQKDMVLEVPSLSATTASLTRIPDVTGMIDINTSHPLLKNTYFSPGTKADGTAFITSVEFQKDSATVSEGDGSYSIPLFLNRASNEMSDLEFDLVLTSGTAADLGDITTHHVTPARESTEMSVPILIIDDGQPESSETFIFEIRNLTGGFHPVVPAQRFKLVIDTPTGVENKTKPLCSVFPNPASSLLSISIRDNLRLYDFILSDVHGREVFSQLNQTGTITVDISPLPDGIFIYRIFDSNRKREIGIGKVLVQR